MILKKSKIRRSSAKTKIKFKKFKIKFTKFKDQVQILKIKSQVQKYLRLSSVFQDQDQVPNFKIKFKNCKQKEFFRIKFKALVLIACYVKFIKERSTS